MKNIFLFLLSAAILLSALTGCAPSNTPVHKGSSGLDTAVLPPSGVMAPDETEKYLVEKFKLNDPGRVYDKNNPCNIKTYTEAEKKAQRVNFTTQYKQMVQAINNKQGGYTFAPGVYRFSGATGIPVYSADNFTLNVNNAVFICEPELSAWKAFVVADSTNFTLKGKCIVNTEIPPFIQGYITKINISDPASSYIDIKLMPGYKLDMANTSDKRVKIFDENTGKQLSFCQYGGCGIQGTSDGNARITRPNGFDDWFIKGAGVKEGRILAFEQDGSALDMSNSSNITVDGLISYGGGSIRGDVEGDFTLRNVQLIPQPGTNRLLDGELYNFNNHGTMTLEDCEFGISWDDGMNYTDGMGMTYKQVAPNQLEISGRLALKVGARLDFSDFENLTSIDSANIVAMEDINDAKTTQAMQSDFDSYHSRMGTISWEVFPRLITLDRNVTIPDHSLIEASTSEHEGMVVRRCYWHDSDASFLCARGLKTGLFENNLFENNAYDAILIGFSEYWMEGPRNSNVTIRGNVFKNNPRRPYNGNPTINVGGDFARPCSRQDIQKGMIIENNKFTGSTSGAIHFTNVSDSIIRNNVFDNSGMPEPIDYNPRYESIYLENCRNITVENNTFIDNKAYSKGVILGSNVDLPSLKVKNNKHTGTDGASANLHLSFTNAAYTAGRAGMTAAAFDGADSYATADRTIIFDFTVSFWLKTTQTAGSGKWFEGAGLVTANGSSDAKGFGTALIGGKFGFGAGNPGATIISDTAVNDGKWHYVAATRQSSNGTLKIYVDGALEKTATVGTMTIDATGEILIGAVDISNKGTMFNGLIDELEIQDKALQDEEISSKYISSLTPAMNFKNNIQPAAGVESDTGLDFNGIDSYGKMYRTIGDNFTIALWVKTAQTAGTGQWYKGAGLVDAEVGGVTNDFGTALLGGKFGFGTGSPDTTITSDTPINDGKWHHVAATREKATGIMKVFVDGKLEKAGKGGTQSLTASEVLRLGAIYPGMESSMFKGVMDQILVLDRVLTDKDIKELSTRKTKNNR